MLTVVILSGGSGTRFWPRSRTRRPKQLLAMVGERSLLQLTVDRVLGLVPKERIFIITNRAQGPESIRQLDGLVPADNIILEPFGRDTAPCIGLAAALLHKTDPDATLAVLPADHLISPPEKFRELLLQASEQAQEGRVITLGVKPRYPATGFGYIELGEVEDQSAKTPLHKVARFKEKPDLETAKSYLEQGRFLWNGGMFIWRASTILAELDKNKPAMKAGLERIAEAWGTAEADAVLEKEYEGFEKISIDYAVLEHCPSICVLEIDFSWDDLGSWTAVEGLHEADEQGNRQLDVEHISIDSKNCFVVGNNKVIATVGVEDLIIVQTDDATLICRRDRVQDVKVVVNELRKRNKTTLLD